MPMDLPRDGSFMWIIVHSSYGGGGATEAF